MGVVGGPDPIVTDGVVFNVDAANIRTIATGSTTVTDMAGNYNGSLSGNASLTNDNVGSFTLSGGTVDLGTVVQPAWTEITIEMWVNADNSSVNAAWLDWGYSEGNGSMFYSHTGTAKGLRGLLYLDTGLKYGAISGTGIMENNIWYHVGMKWSASTNAIEGIFNGQYTGVTVNATGNNVAGGSGKFDLGGEWVSFNGKIAICRIYNRVLSDAEVLQNYNALKDRFV